MGDGGVQVGKEAPSLFLEVKLTNLVSEFIWDGIFENSWFFSLFAGISTIFFFGC